MKYASLRELKNQTSAVVRETARRWKAYRRSGRTVPLDELRRAQPGSRG